MSEVRSRGARRSQTVTASRSQKEQMGKRISAIQRAVPIVHIEQRILMIRSQRVILDVDLARLYGTTTKRLNQQVKRNPQRFPMDFVFRLTSREKKEVVANCDHLSGLKFSATLPYAFTEHGAIMAANLLRSEQAVKVSVFVVRAFVRLREMLSTHRELARKLEELESHLQDHDGKIGVLFDAIRQLMREPPGRRKPPIGYHTEAARKK